MTMTRNPNARFSGYGLAAAFAVAVALQAAPGFGLNLGGQNVPTASIKCLYLRELRLGAVSAPYGVVGSSGSRPGW